MGTQIFLSNDPSSISGYKKAYVGFPGPNASSTVSTCATTTAATGAVDMTLTAGGTVAKWITEPFLSDVLITAIMTSNVWVKESATSENSGPQIVLKEYITSSGTVSSAFQTSAFGTESGTTIAQAVWAKAIDTPTTIDAGNRLIIQPQVIDAGGTQAAGTYTMDYNGLTAGADGDTFITLAETILVSGSQFNNATFRAIAGGPTNMAYGDFVRALDPIAAAFSATPNQMSWGAFREELLSQAGEQSASATPLQSA